jgi:NADPH:quinone reductase-like Zn-dependent oxidoreductase
LAVGAGLKVATVAGIHNHGFVKDLGASYCFDQSDGNIVEEIMKIMKPGDVVFDAISIEASQKPSAEIVHRLGGGKLPVVLMPLPTGHDDVEAVFGEYLIPLAWSLSCLY